MVFRSNGVSYFLLHIISMVLLFYAACITFDLAFQVLQ